MAYHVSPNGPGRCKSKKGRCPFGANGENHYDTILEATAVYEQKLEEAFGVSGITHSRSLKRKIAHYRRVDKVASYGHLVKKTAEAQQARVVLSAKRAQTSVQEKAAILREAGVKVKEKTSAYSAESLKTANAIKTYAAANPATKAIQGQIRDLHTLATDYAGQKTTRNEIRASFKGSHPRTAKPSTVKIGDMLPNGSKVLSVEAITDANGTFYKFKTRDPKTGHFSKSLSIRENSLMTYARADGPVRSFIASSASNRLARAKAAQHRASIMARAGASRARAILGENRARAKKASALQKEVFNTLFNVKAKKVVNESQPYLKDYSSVSAVHSLA